MNLRNLKIGLRLGLGFGLTLAAAVLMMVGAIYSLGASRTELLQSLQKADAQQDVAAEMQNALLNSAISVRNMGLQTDIAALQKDEAEAKNFRAAYLTAKTKLEAGGLNNKERELLVRLGDIDHQTDLFFKEAVDLAAQFNTEQSAAVITKKIHPLSVKASAELADFIIMQKQRRQAVTALTNKSNQSTVLTISFAGSFILLIAAILAWRLTMSITKPLATALEATHRVASGDLVSDIEVDGHDEAAQLLGGMLEMRDGLSSIVSQVRVCAAGISTGSNEIASGNADLSQRTETQASNLEQTAASMEELSSTVKANAETAREANKLASAASDAAINGGVVVGQVVTTMEEITGASKKIADIISVIDGIAFQTNILALNAAVEAARAGEQGRGFAVVASEVRSLAGRSAEAAKEIKNLIGASVEKIEAGSRLVGAAGASMDDIVARVKQVAGLISDISETAHEQTTGIEQINQAIGQLDDMTQQNSALVEEAAAAAESLNQQADRMVEVVNVFKLGDEIFAQPASAAPARAKAGSASLRRLN
jgi:methyl-accepting chemotaxis protein